MQTYLKKVYESTFFNFFSEKNGHVSLQRRIETILREKKLSQIEFAIAINVSEAAISKVMHGSPAGAKIIIGILTSYPDISADWLIRGTGRMYLPDGDLEFFQEPAVQYGSHLYNYHELVRKVEEIDRLVQELKKLTDKTADK